MVALLRQTEGIDPQRIFVLGHSLGGYLLPRIGVADSAIAGLISMATAARPVEDVLLDQVTYDFNLDGVVTEEEQQGLDWMAEQVARVKDPQLSADTPASDLPMGMPAAFWLDVRGYNPVEVAKSLPQPMLILQAGRDFPWTTVDFDLWKTALSSRADVQFKFYPDLYHLFIARQGVSNPEEVDIPGFVAEQVINDIAAWIKGIIP